MKILSKVVKECDTETGKTLVLELNYSHKRKKWKVLIRDYNDEYYEYILKQLRKEVKEAYDKYKAS